MKWLIAQIKYRSKAVVPAVVTLLATALVTFLTASGTEEHIVSLIPGQYQSIGTLVIGAVITGIVHQIRLGAKPATANDAAPTTELPENLSTTIVQTVPATDDH